MPAYTLTGVAGAKSKNALSTSAQAFTIAPVSGRLEAKVQIVCNSAWLYGSADHGATADDWLTVGAGTVFAIDVGPGGFTFYAKVGSGSPNLHVVEL